MEHNASPFIAVPLGVKVCVKLTPKSGANKIGGIIADAAGAAVIKASVAAAPEKGKANEALIKMLASEWRLPKTSLTVASGKTARRKTIFIEGDAASLIMRLNQWARKEGDK